LRVTKFFLVQHLVELDMTHRSSFDDVDAHNYFANLLRLSGKDKKHKIEVFTLSIKPYSWQDLLLESYEYRGYTINIYQNAETVGADIRAYFSTIVDKHTKKFSQGLVAEGDEVEVVKKAAEESVDYRLS
jgi:hypothetical protein